MGKYFTKKALIKIHVDVCSVTALTHSFQVKFSLPAQLLLS